MMRRLILLATLFVPASGALACLPAPGCWMDPTDPPDHGAYLKAMCHEAHNSLILGGPWDRQTDENNPNDIRKFIAACAKLHITVRKP